MSGIGGMSCMTDAGYRSGEKLRAAAVQSAATIKSSVATAIAAANADQAVSNFRSQRDISRRSLAIAQIQQKRLQEVFWPHELEFLQEYANPEQIEAVETMGRRYGGRLVAAAADKFSKRLQELRCNRPRYCTSASEKALQDLMLVRSETMAAMRVLGRNIAFTEYQVRSDTNVKRRLQAVAVGRGLMSEAARLLGQAAGNLAQAGGAALSGLNSALFTLGEGIQEFRAGREQMAAASAPTAQSYLPYSAPGSQSAGPSPGAAQRFGNNLDAFGGYNIGMGSINQAMDQTAAGDPIGFNFDGLLNSQTFQFSPNQGLQQERWNTGRIGYQDLARGGQATFGVTSITGGSVTVQMNQFPLQYVDGYTEGEYGPMFSGP